MKYAQPQESGGKLIRKVIQFLKANKLPLPITSHILIGVSGGADSLALAQLLIKYGRRVVPISQIKILHINHGWRGKESDSDAEKVRAFAQASQVPFILKNLQPPSPKDRGESWENLARAQRKAIYENLARKYQARILTAHHGDDLAETVLWRILTGASQTHLEGIRFEEGVEVRPLLAVRKQLLYDFLKEEGLEWSEDSTNGDPRFLRARMRAELMPRLERIFPRGVQHLIDLGLSAETERGDAHIDWPAGIRIKRAHYRNLIEKQKDPHWKGEFTLPAGWKLVKSPIPRK